MLDASDFRWDEDLDVDFDDGGELPPLPPSTGGGKPRRRKRGLRRIRVWPWIAGIVALLALERLLVLGVIELGEAWIWVFAGVGVVGSAALIAIGGWTFARMR